MKYLIPHSIEEAGRLLTDNKNSFILAGGTDLLIEKRSGKISPNAVIDLKRIEHADSYLSEIVYTNGKLEIGALVTVTQLLEYGNMPSELASLIDAGKKFGCYEIRNRATIAGNLAHASPGSEYGSTLIALNAEVEIFKPGGMQKIPVEALYAGAGKTVLDRKDIITRIIVPVTGNSASAYFRASRVDGMDLAIINCALQGIYDKSSIKISYRVSLGAVSSVPMRFPKVEEILRNIDSTDEKSAEEVLSKVKQFFLKTLNPRATSLRAAPFTKKILAGNLLEDAYNKVRERLKK